MLTLQRLERWAHENSVRYCMAPVGASIPFPDGLPGAVLKGEECSNPTQAMRKLRTEGQAAARKHNGARPEPTVALAEGAGVFYCEDIPLDELGPLMAKAALFGFPQTVMTDADSKLFSPHEALTALIAMKEQGLKYVPLCSHTGPAGQCLGHTDPKEKDLPVRVASALKDAFMTFADTGATNGWHVEQVMDWLNKKRAELLEKGLEE